MRKGNLPYNLKYEVNGLTRTFLNKNKLICQTMKNQQFYKTLINLKIKTNINIVNYDKVNSFCLMPQYDYLNKFSSVVEDKTYFKLAEKNKRKNSRHRLIRKMIKQNLKLHIDKHTYNNLITGGNSTGKLYETCKVH